jgi:hypothetical protein
VQDGVIRCTGKPTGALRTPRMYENFILELQWRHLTPGGNAGIFVWSSPIAAPGVPFLRAIEVQVLDNGFNIPGKNQWYTTHGDVFPIHGSTMEPIHKGNGSRCFPLEERSKSSPEWNHYRIVGRDGKLRLSVNGKEVSGGDECVWRKGYLGLESEDAPTEWRHIRIQGLPPSGATPEQTAPEDQGWRPLYNGVDLRGWRADAELNKQWVASDWQLANQGGPGVLWSEDQWGDFELVVDCQASKNAAASESPSLVLSPAADGPRIALGGKAGSWTRYVITVRGQEFSVRADKGESETKRFPAGVPPRRAIGLVGGPARFANLYIRELQP